jgi:phosphoribosylformimino-5-aminoimidazole carboxamide ribotide isomerase
MQVIPVIDLKDNAVVHAKQGLRDTYLPIHSALCPSSDIFDVIRAYLNVYEFQTFYIADLNALEGNGDHQNTIHNVAKRFPERTFWLDSGLITGSLSNLHPINIKTVLGSESFGEETASQLRACPKDFILSLDYAESVRLGAQNLFDQPDCWPNDIIIMTLERVGSHSGPDFEKLANFSSNYPNKNFIAAGGIRNLEDLLALEKIGIRQALIASALHSGAISRTELAALFRQKNTPTSGVFLDKPKKLIS